MIEKPIYQALEQSALELEETKLKLEHTENRLRHSEARLNAFLYYSPVGIGIWDRDFRYVYINEIFQNIIGPSPDTHIGQMIGDVLPKAAQIIVPIFESIFSNCKPILNRELSCEVPSRPGEIRHFKVSFFPICVNDGKPKYIGGVVVDITEHKMVEKDLQKTKEKFHSLFDMSMEAIVLSTDSGEILEANPSFLKFIGVESLSHLRDFNAKNFWLDGKARKVWISSLKENGYATDFETKVKRLDGTVIDINASAIKLDSDKGSFIVSTIRDMTERKHAERALKESEKKYRDLFDDAPILYVITEEHDGIPIIKDVNKVFFELLGYSREQVIGKSLAEFYTPESVNELFNRGGYERALSGTFTKAERSFVARDGKIIDTLVQAVLEKRKPGHGRVVRSTFLDISERKKAESEKNKLQAQLFQAQKMESVGRLAGGVAHDFNNMLSIILGNTELIMDDIGADNPLLSKIMEVRKAAERSADFTRQLLAFARKQTIAPKVLDLNKTLVDMLNMLRRLIGEGIDLDWFPKSELWPVKIDPSQVHQVLANLCVNARDSINGIGKITIETDNVTLDDHDCRDRDGLYPGNYAMIRVTDNGCGIEKQNLEKLFEPFFTTKDIGEGNGLGLATVYGIVKQNNGFIYINSKPGGGTKVELFLPRHAGVKEQVKAPQARDVNAAAYETILLVEDEEAILRMTAMMLERFGYKVTTASSPAEAIRVARSCTGEIDLLMTDVVMPEMSGLDLAHTLLRLYPNLNCLFMSGYPADVIIHQGVLRDGMPFLHKPFTSRRLAEKVRQVLDGVGDATWKN